MSATPQRPAHKQPPHYPVAQDVIASWGENYNKLRLHAGLRSIEPAKYFRGDPKRRMTKRRARFESDRLCHRQINLVQVDQGVKSIRKSCLHAVEAAVYGYLSSRNWQVF